MPNYPAGLLPVCAALFIPAAVSVVQLHASAQKPADTWTVLMHVSGGIAGLDREIRVASSGAVTAADRRRRLSSMGIVPAAVLAEIDAIVSKLPAPADQRPPSGCRDCLLYRLEIKRATIALTADFDDLSVAGTPFEQLVKTLTTQLTEALRQ